MNATDYLYGAHGSTRNPLSHVISLEVRGGTQPGFYIQTGTQKEREENRSNIRMREEEVVVVKRSKRR